MQTLPFYCKYLHAWRTTKSHRYWLSYTRRWLHVYAIQKLEVWIFIFKSQYSLPVFAQKFWLHRCGIWTRSDPSGWDKMPGLLQKTHNLMLYYSFFFYWLDTDGVQHGAWFVELRRGHRKWQSDEVEPSQKKKKTYIQNFPEFTRKVMKIPTATMTNQSQRLLMQTCCTFLNIIIKHEKFLLHAPGPSALTACLSLYALWRFTPCMSFWFRDLCCCYCMQNIIAIRWVTFSCKQKQQKNYHNNNDNNNKASTHLLQRCRFWWRR